jgi:hypothetical protein
MAGCLMPALAAAPWKFAVLGDGRTGGENGNTTGVNDVVVRALAAEIVKQKVDLVIFSGDLVNGSARFGPLEKQLENWKLAMAAIYEAKIPLYVVRGNHELAAAQDQPKGRSVAAWRAAFPDMPQNGPADEKGLTYSVDYANARFVAIDQFVGKKPGFDVKVYDSAVNSGMVSPWAIARIQESGPHWVFAFGHEAAFPGHHVDCLGNVPAEREALWDALGARGGVYFAGHDHMYVRQVAPDRAKRPVLTLVVGDAGAPAYPYDNSGFSAGIGRQTAPQNFFVNAKPDDDAGKKAAADKAYGPKVENTNGLPMYFGLVVVTVDGDKLSGEWRAFTNYNTNTATGPAAPEPPKFETLDRFAWPAK